MITNDTLEQRAAALLETMTLEEKVGQLTQYFYMDIAAWPPQREFLDGEVRAGRSGSLLFVTNPRETNRLQRIAVEESRLGVPLLFGCINQQLAGLRRMLPWLANVHAFSWDTHTSHRLPLASGKGLWRGVFEVLESSGRDHGLLLEFVADDDPSQLIDDACTLRSWLGA